MKITIVNSKKSKSLKKELAKKIMEIVKSNG